MRHSISLIAAATLAAACTDPKFHCADTGGCPLGTTCDTAQKLCVIPGGCSTICKTNEACIAAACVLQSCPVCNANEQCNDTTFKCEKVTTGTIKIISPAGGGVIGGATASVVANAGGPNGVLHVDFTLKASGGAQISTVSVSAGDPQGNYSGTLSLSGATTSTGNTLVATVFWNDAAGVTQQTPSGTTTVTIDETPPSISGITTDQLYYSTVVGGSATVTATIADSGGSAGIKGGSVQLTVGAAAPVAGTLRPGSTYQFTVPLAGLVVGGNTFTISASDAVNNTGTQTGTLNVDNIPPVFGTLSVPGAFFSGAAIINPAITAAVTDTGGAGVKANSVQIKLDATHFIPNDSFGAGSATWNSLTGASFLLPDGQQAAVPFTFVATDSAGNPVESGPQSIKIDRKGPAVGSVSAPVTYSACAGSVSVTAVVDDDVANGGSGAAGAALHIIGQSDTTGVFVSVSSTMAKTYSFSVPATVQAANTDTPITFAITGADIAGNQTPAAAAAVGNVLIDCAKPVVQSIAITGGVPVNGVAWFKQAASGTIPVTANILERGSGVKASSLQLQATNLSNARVDTTGATPICGAANPLGVAACTFLVPLSLIATGLQQEYDLVVVGSDNAGNPMATGGSNSSKLGIDGLAPTVTFNIITYSTSSLPGGASGYYPAPGAGCNGGIVDPALFCGHDGSHVWRKGESSMLITIATDGSGGSGILASSVTYSIAGSTTCTVAQPCSAVDAGSGNFSFVPDLSTATFSSGVEGTGTVSITVNATDAVGNASSATMSTLQASRVKWVRSMAGKVISFKGSPVFTSQPSAQIILAGAEGGDSNGVIASFKPDGTLLWRAGKGDVTTITNNVAYSSATKTLYVLGDGANKLFAYTIGTSSATTAYNCPLQLATNGQAVGAPALINSGGKEFALVSDSALNQLWAFTGATGSCSFSSSHFNNTNAWTSIANPPTTDGNLVYLPHDGTTASSVAFTAGSFGAVTNAPAGFVIPIFGPISIANLLFFGNTNTPGQLFSYSTDFVTANWPAGNGLVTSAPLRAPVVVSASYAFGVPTSGDGHFKAFSKSNGSLAWAWIIGTGTTSQIGTPSAPGLGNDGTIYFTADKNSELVPLQVSSNTPSLAGNWSSTFQGSINQKISTPATDTTLDSVGTEPTIDSGGVLYFGTLAGKVFAIITDSTGTLIPTASTWPRVGYDNCNSSNTAFSCQ